MKLTESQLRSIIRNCVTEALLQDGFDPSEDEIEKEKDLAWSNHENEDDEMFDDEDYDDYENNLVDDLLSNLSGQVQGRKNYSPF